MKKIFDIEYVGCDFDATLSMIENQYPVCGEPSEGFDVLKEFQAVGGKVILWTCRTGKDLEMAVEFCKEQGLTPDSVNQHLPEQIVTAEKMGIEISPKKIYCHMYIDDKSPEAIYNGIDWKLIRRMLLEQNKFTADKVQPFLPGWFSLGNGYWKRGEA